MISFALLILERFLKILSLYVLFLGAGLMQGLVETGSFKDSVKYVNFKVLSGKLFLEINLKLFV